MHVGIRIHFAQIFLSIFEQKPKYLGQFLALIQQLIRIRTKSGLNISCEPICFESLNYKTITTCHFDIWYKPENNIVYEWCV